MKIPAFLRDPLLRRIRIYAACGAYHVFTAIIPAAVILCFVLPHIPVTRERLLGTLFDYVPGPVYELLDNVTSSAYTGKAAILPVSVLLAVISASSAAAALMRGLNMIYGAEKTCGFLRARIRACFYILAAAAAAFLSLGIMITGDRIVSALKPGRLLAGFIRCLRYFTVMLLLWLFFTLLYKWMPEKKLKYIPQMKGAAFSAAVWVIFTFAFSEYADISGRYGIYGFFGTVMIAVMWIYYLIYFFLIGAFINNRKKDTGG